MNELELWIKKINLIFTKTVSKRELLDNEIDVYNETINYDNCLSLYNIISIYNRLHKSLIKEYGRLDKLNLGNYVRIKRFFKEDSYRELSIRVHERANKSKDDRVLCIINDNDEIKSYLTNDINPHNNDYFIKEINVDYNKAKKYLDLFEKYNLVLYLYNLISNNMVFSDGTHNLISKINSSRNYYLDYIYTICISINDSVNSIKICLNLGDNISIISKESSIKIENNLVKISENDYQKILKNIYLNVSYLNSYWDRINHKEKVDSKTLIKTIDRI